MSEITLKPIKKNNLLITSIAVSVGIHALGLYFLYTNPMVLRHSLSSLFGLSIAAPDYIETAMEPVLEKNKMIEEVFDVLVLSPHLQQPFDLVELPRGLAIAPDQEALAPLGIQEQPLDLPTAHPESWALANDQLPLVETDLLFDSQSLLVRDNTQFLAVKVNIQPTISSYEIEQISLPAEDKIYVIDPMSVPQPNIAFSLEKDGEAAHLNECLAHRFFQSEQTSLKIESKVLEIDTTLGTNRLTEHVPFIPHPPLTKIQAPHLNIAAFEADVDDYLPSAFATAAEWNDDFDLDITFLPHPDGEGYIFNLSLLPNFDMTQYSLKHDLLFVIDRTSSVRKHRFPVFKRAVLKALSSLQQGDTFNIFIIDKNITRFNAASLPVSQKSIKAAEHFLEKQGDDDLFSHGDIYSSMEKILPELKGADSVHTAILLTDGTPQLSTRKQQHVLKNWIEKNNGRLSVYTAAVGPKNDLLMLDLLSSVSSGKLLWSDTHAAFPRKLAKLVLDLKDPIATDLVIDLIPHETNTRIKMGTATFYPSVLFSHQPYTVVGSIDHPGPFDLIIQGRHKDQWIAIKKTVSFMDGSKGDQSLVKQWSSQKVYRSYVKFLNDGKTTDLKEAKEILKKSRSELAFD